MKQITLSINGITKELELVGNNKKVDSSYHLIEGDWYREVEPAKPTYEILSFEDKILCLIWKQIHTNTFTTTGKIAFATLEHLLEDVQEGTVCIHSVKRLSNNEVFTVGKDEENGKITKIVIEDDVVFLYSVHDNWVKLDHAKKVKQLTILLTTEEGVEITDRDQKIYFCNKDFDKYDFRVGDLGGGLPGHKYFSTEEARDEYILQNKPITVFLKDLSDRIIFKEAQVDLLTSFFKSKQRS